MECQELQAPVCLKVNNISQEVEILKIEEVLEVAEGTKEEVTEEDICKDMDNINNNNKPDHQLNQDPVTTNTLLVILNKCHNNLE